ncbi:MAG: hypothetical protein FK731_02660 [Asgard group archaeon]|nr:hypothetical protein [Asgard group archaeon]
MKNDKKTSTINKGNLFIIKQKSVKTMNYFNPKKLHTSFETDLTNEIDFLPRKYTLTHSDRTGDMFLTIGKKYDKEKISKFYVRFMRDEVLGEWKKIDGNYELHLYVHISGGLIFGWAGMRDKIIRNHLPMVYRVIRYGDNELFKKIPQLDDCPLYVHFKSNRKRYNKIERIGLMKNFK